MKFLPSPKSGPYISTVTFSTPFLQMVAYSDRYVGNYSAQQAQIDYRNKREETVRISVEILLTDSYGRWIQVSGSSSNSPAAFVPRPHDFWKDFQAVVYAGDQALTPADFHGHGNSNCGRRGSCTLVGATLELDFPADAFTSNSATIDITPPEGDPVSVEFDLSSLR